MDSLTKKVKKHLAYKEREAMKIVEGKTKKQKKISKYAKKVDMYGY